MRIPNRMAAPSVVLAESMPCQTVQQTARTVARARVTPRTRAGDRVLLRARLLGALAFADASPRRAPRGRRAKRAPGAAPRRGRLDLSARRLATVQPPASRSPLATARRGQAQEQQAEEARAARQPRTRAARLRSDAALLLHPRLGPLRGRTVLVPVAVLAGLRGDRQHEQRPRPAGLAGARTARSPDRPAQLPRHEQLRRAGRHLHEHARRLRRHRRAADRPRRRQVLRRQRLDRHRDGAHLQTDARSRRARLCRGHHGLRDGRLLDRPESRLPRRHPVLQQRRKHRSQHDHHGTRRRARGAALPDHRQRAVPAVRRRRLQLGAHLPAAAERPVRRPHPSARRRRSRPTGATTRA